MISGVSRTYEELEVGAVYRSRHGRTVLEADNVWFSLLTLNTNPIHFDAEYAATTEWGRPLVDSTFTLALVTGLSVEDVSERGVNLGWREVRLPAPVFAGDTIYAWSEVLERMPVTGRGDLGALRLRTVAVKNRSCADFPYKGSDGKHLADIVLDFDYTVLMPRRG
jgi:acyl dehydratase